MRIIAGIHKNRPLVTPKGMETRPTSSKLREALFNICQAYVEDSDFLDLFAGSGAMGLEALSRGAREAVFVDSSKEAIKAIHANIKMLHFEKQSKVLFNDVFRAIDSLTRAGSQFDLIYADPPYHDLTIAEKIINKIDQVSLLKEGGLLFIEIAADTDLQGVELSALKLLNFRKMGRSTLMQYQRGL